MSKDEMNDMPDRKGRGLKPCPGPFIDVGAASILLRHTMEDGENCDALFDALDAAVAIGLTHLKACGINRMESAGAELDIYDAKTEYKIGDKKRAVLLQMRGHSQWAEMLHRHGYETPTDEDIQKVHIAQLEAKRAARAAVSTQLEKLSATANGR